METFDSTEYWRQRYRDGGTSGSGSYGRLAVYKAHLVNAVVHAERIKRIIEFGSGDGHQASLFWVPSYLGVDVSTEAVELSRQRLDHRTSHRFITMEDFVANRVTADLTMSLDVIFHLVEDDTFDRYMATLFDSSDRLVLVYSSDQDLHQTSEHVRHRLYSRWIDEQRPDWRLREEFAQPFPRTPTSRARHTSPALFKLFERNVHRSQVAR